MLRYMLAATFAAGLTVPALAECNQEIDVVWSVVEASELSDEEKNEVASVLEGAQQQSEAGDEDGCMATVEQVRVALDLEQ